MSYVSGVVLCTGLAEDANEPDDQIDAGPDAPLNRINAWLTERRFSALTRVEDRLGEGKHPQMYVAGAGQNYFDEDAFSAFVIGLPWKEPGRVVLVIQPQNGTTRVWRPDHQTEED